MSKKETCMAECDKSLPWWMTITGNRACKAICRRQYPELLNEVDDTAPKKDIQIAQDLRQYQYQQQLEIAQEVQAPFVYAPVKTSAYAPVFQVYSPQAHVGVGIEQEAVSKIDMLLRQAQDLAQRQTAEQVATQRAEATISEEEKTAQSLLGSLIVAGGLGAVGYVGYTEYKKRGKKGGLKKKHDK